jgi:hypothetical protein
MAYVLYKCKVCGNTEHLREVAVKRWTAWFICTNEHCLPYGEQSFNRELYQQSPAKLNQERFA